MPATAEARTYTVPQAARLLGLSRGFAYQMAGTGELAGVKVLRVGSRLLVPRAALDALLAGEATEREA